MTVETKEAVVSGVSVHHVAAEHVRLVRLAKAGSYCLTIGPIEIYGTVAELEQISGRAAELIEQARKAARDARNTWGPTP